MAVKRNQKALLKKLKKQVRLLQRKEEQGRNKLRTALKKIRKLGRSYKTKISKKLRTMKNKIVEAQAETYYKVAADIEREMLKGIEAKSKALKSSIHRLEKKHIARLTHSIAKKGKKLGKGKSYKPQTRGKRVRGSKNRGSSRASKRGK